MPTFLTAGRPIPDDATQMLRIKVDELLHGESPGGTLVVTKPLAPYTLKVGDTGRSF